MKPSLRRGLMLARFGLVCVGLMAALLLDTPFSHRAPLAFGAIILLASVLAYGRLWIARRAKQRLSASAHVAAALLGLAASWAIGHALYRSAQRHRVLDASPHLLRGVGQHLLVGYKKVDEVRRLARLGAIGGIFVTTRNLEARGLDALRDEIAALQALRHAQGLPPLIVAADQEGGAVSRLSPWLSALPPLSEPAAIDDAAKRRDAVRRYAAVHGRELSRLGVTLNLGPVADLRVTRDKGSADLYSQIAERAIHHEPLRVREVTEVYARELRAWGVMTTLKHFPGLGRVTADTHFFAGKLDSPLSTLRSADWVPYQRLGARQAVMLGHVRLSDGELASTSPRATAWLRKDLQVRGLLITDDLCMVPAWARRGGAAKSALHSLNAGVDLILVSLDPRQVYRVLDGLLDAAADGRLHASSLRESKKRLRRARSMDALAKATSQTP